MTEDTKKCGRCVCQVKQGGIIMRIFENKHEYGIVPYCCITRQFKHKDGKIVRDTFSFPNICLDKMIKLLQKIKQKYEDYNNSWDNH